MLLFVSVPQTGVAVRAGSRVGFLGLALPETFYCLCFQHIYLQLQEKYKQQVRTHPPDAFRIGVCSFHLLFFKLDLTASSLCFRVIPIILFLQWLKIHSHYEAAQEAINDLPKKPKFYSSAH